MFTEDKVIKNSYIADDLCEVFDATMAKYHRRKHFSLSFNTTLFFFPQICCTFVLI